MPIDIQAFAANENRVIFEQFLWLIGTGIATGIVLGLIARFSQRPTVRYFIIENKLEFFTGIFAIIGYLISYLFVQQPGTSFLLSIIVTFIATIVIVYSKTREKDLYFVSLQKPGDKEDWIGEGIFQYERVYNAYTITNSDSGFIFSKCLIWSDYTMDFDFKILDKSIGAIIRATNLSNLVMLQIFDRGINAHVRVSGFWHMQKPEITGLSFEKTLNMDSWYHCSIQCDKRSIRIKIRELNDDTIFDRNWTIPAGPVTFSYEPAEPEKIGWANIAAVSSIPFPINLEYGTIGFRNYGTEKAVTKNLLVKRL